MLPHQLLRLLVFQPCFRSHTHGHAATSLCRGADCPAPLAARAVTTKARRMPASSPVAHTSVLAQPLSTWAGRAAATESLRSPPPALNPATSEPRGPCTADSV